MVGLGHRGAEAELELRLQRTHLLRAPSGCSVGEVQVDLDQTPRSSRCPTFSRGRATRARARSAASRRPRLHRPPDVGVGLEDAAALEAPPWTSRNVVLDAATRCAAAVVAIVPSRTSSRLGAAADHASVTLRDREGTDARGLKWPATSDRATVFSTTRLEQALPSRAQVLNSPGR